MMRVPVELKPSPIHGTGVFATEDICPNALVWAFSRIFDHLIFEHVWARGSEAEKQKLFERGYRNSDSPEAIVMCGDEGQFLNFPRKGQQANLKIYGWVNDQPALVAAREIKAGEEITVPPESDTDYSRKMEVAPQITVEDVEEAAKEGEPTCAVPEGIRDGEDVV